MYFARVQEAWVHCYIKSYSIVVSSFPFIIIVTNSIDNCDKKTVLEHFVRCYGCDMSAHIQKVM